MKRFVLAGSAIFISTISIFGQPAVGQTFRINFNDVDGNALSTADGRITTLVLSSKANIDKAHVVGERTPDFCLGNPDYRMITVVSFATKHSRPVRAVLRSLMRSRIDSEARQLQMRYEKLKIARNARRDVLAVADFDGEIAQQLGAKSDTALFHVFVFGKNGELLKKWSDVPSAEELAAALKQN